MTIAAEVAELFTSPRARWGVALITREFSTKIEPHVAKELLAQIQGTLAGMPRLSDEHAEWMRRGRDWTVGIAQVDPPLKFTLKTWEAERLARDLESAIHEAERRQGYA